MTTVEAPSAGRPGISAFTVAFIDNPGSLGDLLESFRLVEAEHRRSGRCFLTLDDLSQCLYTSGHARDRYELADVDYPEEETPEARAGFEQQRFAAAQKSLRSPVTASAWDSMVDRRTTSADDIDALATLNEHPDVILDDVHVVSCLPTDLDADLLAAIPNGYFSGDWTPYDCFALTERLASVYGYSLIGMGSRTMAFSRVVEEGRVTEPLLADLQQIYGHADQTDAWDRLRSTLTHAPLLLLGYTEDFAELVEDL